MSSLFSTTCRLPNLHRTFRIPAHVNEYLERLDHLSPFWPMMFAISRSRTMATKYPSDEALHAHEARICPTVETPLSSATEANHDDTIFAAANNLG